MFDVPMGNKVEKSNYRKLKKQLKILGYIALQESVYVKLLKNTSNTKNEIKKLKDNIVASGSVLVLPMSLENFKQIQSVTGAMFDLSLFSDDTIYV